MKNCSICGNEWSGKGAKCNTCKSKLRRQSQEKVDAQDLTSDASTPSDAPTICNGKPIGKGSEFTLRAELRHAHYHKYSCTPTKEEARKSMSEYLDNPGFVHTSETHAEWLSRRMKETGAGSKIIRLGPNASGSIEIPLKHTENDIDDAIAFYSAKL